MTKDNQEQQKQNNAGDVSQQDTGSQSTTVVSKSEFEKVLSEALERKQRLRELEAKLQKLEEEKKLAERQKLDEVERLRLEKTELETKLKSIELEQLKQSTMLAVINRLNAEGKEVDYVTAIELLHGFVVNPDTVEADITKKLNLIAKPKTMNPTPPTKPSQGVSGAGEEKKITPQSIKEIENEWRAGKITEKQYHEKIKAIQELILSNSSLVDGFNVSPSR